MPKPQYGRAHQQLLAAARRAFVEGQPCPQPVRGVVCGKPMYSSQRLELGHDDLGGYLGLVHATCNHRAGAIKGNRGRGRTCRRCRTKFVPQRRTQWLCGSCRTDGPPAIVSRPW